ncbi:hypothetical protein PANT111_130451 [Pantoea brenneri]|uniref:Uncharacterized protein n=1 Tax=Pantoea brenneri TaxID=472694 RepID=A0AAX3J2N4_9GAMM|nr:hypothetical protein PANT111_130451 [Pantoea brenneri]
MSVPKTPVLVPDITQPATIEAVTWKVLVGRLQALTLHISRDRPRAIVRQDRVTATHIHP